MTAPTPSTTLPRPTRVLFVGGEDSVGSRLAAGLLQRSAGDRVEVDAAQTRPVDPAEPTSDLVLTEAGLDPAEHPAHPLSASALRRSDRVISLGHTVDVARLPGPRYETWETPYTGRPAADPELRRRWREDLAVRVRALAADLTAPPAPRPSGSPVHRLLGRLRELVRR